MRVRTLLLCVAMRVRRLSCRRNGGPTPICRALLYCNAPCAHPSRSSLWSGRHPHHIPHSEARSGLLVNGVGTTSKATLVTERGEGAHCCESWLILPICTGVSECSIRATPTIDKFTKSAADPCPKVLTACRWAFAIFLHTSLYVWMPRREILAETREHGDKPAYGSARSVQLPAPRTCLSEPLFLPL
jgi:hypothetical protein